MNKPEQEHAVEDKNKRSSTVLIIFGEGIDIMLRRFREYLRREDEIKAKAKDEVYKEVAAWDRRRRDAEAQGVEFKEPPPTKPPDISQEKQKE